MSEGFIIELMQLTMQSIAFLSAPVIITVLVVGILSQVAQTVTQMKDMSLTFVPKVCAAGIVMTLAVPWYIQVSQKYVEIIFSYIGRASM
jgi:flagellar biosynthesis protein FliQ